MYKPKIYFAGKCNNGNHQGRYDWRIDLASEDIMDAFGCDIKNKQYEYSSFIYCGPSVIDDHNWYGKELAQSCIGQIKECDAVFAWIDSYDCYGTLFELGYAKGLGKPVFIYHKSCLPDYSTDEDNELICSNDEHWLCKELCDYSAEAPNHKVAFFEDFMHGFVFNVFR